PTLALSYAIALQGVFPSRSLTAGDSYLGSVAAFAAGFAPKFYALANGQILPITQNAALFSILGTTYGGNGTSNFALPDLRGRVPIHRDQQGIYPQGDMEGEEQGFLSISQMLAHNHAFNGGNILAAVTAPNGVTILSNP